MHQVVLIPSRISYDSKGRRHSFSRADPRDSVKPLLRERSMSSGKASRIRRDKHWVPMRMLKWFKRHQHRRLASAQHALVETARSQLTRARLDPGMRASTLEHTASGPEQRYKEKVDAEFTVVIIIAYPTFHEWTVDEDDDRSEAPKACMEWDFPPGIGFSGGIGGFNTVAWSWPV